MLYQPWTTIERWETVDPKLKQLERAPFRLPHLDAALEKIPDGFGIFGLLGPRQVGKSTLLRLLAKQQLRKFAPDRVVIVEGDAFETWRELLDTLTAFLASERPAAILIDEITAIREWHRSLKLLADRGSLEKVKVIYTGSSAMTLREGGEFFPGRRGTNAVTNIHLVPASYRHVHKKMNLETYFKVGGFPWAVNEYLRLGAIPDYVGEIYWSWLKGELLKRGKSEVLLRHILHALVPRITSGVSQNKLAREMGITSNETARQYLELLVLCFALNEVPWFDPVHKILSPRKNKKYYPIDPFLYHMFASSGLYANQWMAIDTRTETMGTVAELVVCQELIQKHPDLGYWSGKREIDFVPPMIEVKYQNTVSPGEFAWFEKTVPKPQRLTVLTKVSQFNFGRVRAMPLEEWLLTS
ncbi:MAG: ATP-binding protein [Deltaproteobacteria bacterium]|nr:ATP-binding protein [Deltaproteobacteria bacterium]